MICGKEIFVSQTLAAQSMRGKNRDQRPGRSINRLSHVYFCTDCQGWHMASKQFNKVAERNKFREEKSISKPREPRFFGVYIITNYSSQPIGNGKGY
jgi:hypothetical protein